MHYDVFANHLAVAFQLCAEISIDVVGVDEKQISWLDGQDQRVTAFETQIGSGGLSESVL